MPNFAKGFFQKIKVKLILASLFVSACQDNQSPFIETIQTLRDVHFEDIETDAPVIFDIDETLIQPMDTYLINEHTPQAIEFRKKLLQKYSDVKNWDHIASIMLKEAQRPLIEAIILLKIQGLKDRSISFIACTGMNTGPYGIYPNLEEWRYNHLKSLGFEGSYASLILKIDSFKRRPGFYKGILSTDLEPKGPVIGAFLDKINVHPQKIVMFDDDLDNLLSVQKECKKRTLSFKGYHYKGAQKKLWDEKLIQFQADYLIKNKKWLSDSEAESLMKKSTSLKILKERRSEKVLFQSPHSKY